VEDRLDELRGLVRAGRYVQAVRACEALLEAGALEPAEQATVYHIESVAYYQSDRLFEAVRAAKTAEELAVNCRANDLVQRVRVNLVALYCDVGDTQLAVEMSEKLLADQANLSPEVRQELPRVHYNLARVYRGRREKGLMFDHLKQAIELAKVVPHLRSFLVMAHQLLAWWLCLEERLREADEHIQAAGTLLEPGETEQVREQLLLAGLRAYQAGDVHTAVELVEEFITPGTPSTLRQSTWAYWILAEAALSLDRLEEAGSFAERALQDAIELAAPDLMNRANDLQHRISKRREAG
jgi:tetratricopeptide (TPR) repeat protein